MNTATPQKGKSQAVPSIKGIITGSGEPGWYFCVQCCTAVKDTDTPDRNGCAGSKDHSWKKIEESDYATFYCKHCNALLHTSQTPMAGQCTVAQFHHWKML